ncbi:MAG TPA: phage tail tube protein [Thermodesulfobacteriota bacterium]
MSKNVIYAALGEEAQRGVGESAAVGFVPLLNPAIPRVEFEERERREFRGEEAALGLSSIERASQRWSASIDLPFFTESGASKALMGTLLKHFFGRCSSAQNGSTGQYRHMFYPVADPFSETCLGDRALTLNLNINEGDTVRNWPYVGGRVKSLAFEQDAGHPLKLTAGLMGQKKDDSTAEIGNPLFAAENLRCDYNNLSIYSGAITRTGTAPDFTAFSAGGAVAVRPDKITVKMENGMEDALRLSGVDYPDRTRMGLYKVTAELTIDWEDPASGFSSIGEFRDWLSGAGETNLFLRWDTGTQAGSGGNHGLSIDLPRLYRKGGEPEYKIDKDPLITLKYEALYDAAAAKYMAGVMLINTAETV